jgi:predicted FMN-binding regulatory protein PaiB
MKEGNLVVLPGLPAFYDYEWYPQPVDVREMPRYNKRCIHWNGRFSTTRNYHQASMMSLRLERSKFTSSPEFLVEFDDEFG